MSSAGSPRGLRRLLARATVVVLALATPSALVAAAEGRVAPAVQPQPAAPSLPGVVPARICGSHSLDGPATPPPGAKVVTTQNLGDLARRSRPGRVFWIAPGVHHLGGNQYSQVQPRDRQVFIGAPGAIIDGQHKNLYAFTGLARGVRIEHLTITDFGQRGDNPGEAVVNHDSAHGWRILHNTISHDAGAGVFLGTRTRVVSNCLAYDGEYGFQAFSMHGAHHVVLRHNEIAHNNADDWESIQPGCGCAGGGKFWDTDGAVVTDNWVHDNHGPGLWADTDNRGFLFAGNYLNDNDGQGIFYEISYNAHIVHNTFVRNGIVSGPTNNGIVAAIYISESGSDPRVHTAYSHTFRISHNLFVDNWSGILAWENPDRFAGSPVNSSSGYTTLVAPGVATVRHCGNPSLIGKQPYFDDCRWKTKNLRVTHNRFTMDPTAIAGCAPAIGCGWNVLAANVGTVPDWSPYKGYVVPRHITFTQHNRWSDNTYVGPWRWVAYTLGNQVSWNRWRGHFGQDAGSTRS